MVPSGGNRTEHRTSRRADSCSGDRSSFSSDGLPHPHETFEQLCQHNFPLGHRVIVGWQNVNTGVYMLVFMFPFLHDNKRQRQCGRLDLAQDCASCVNAALRQAHATLSAYVLPAIALMYLRSGLGDARSRFLVWCPRGCIAHCLHRHLLATTESSASIVI